MIIYPINITIRELTENYTDKGDEGVFGYNNRLTIRPSYQREFVYNNKQRGAVIETVLDNCPLNVMYWAKTGKDSYEVLDGQQRTISISQFINKDFPIVVNGDDKFFQNLTQAEKDRILNYTLIVYVCDGTDEEKLKWFSKINIAGEKLTEQELLNATYCGSWLSDAKRYFSKRGCVAEKLADGYVKGNSIRQEYLEKVLAWKADADGLKTIQQYMARHQFDTDANELWQYYNQVVCWAKMLFPKKRKGVTDTADWGMLYNKYHNNFYNTNQLEAELQKLLVDDDVTKKSGIVAYLLSERTFADERSLSIRAFSESQKRTAYERQNHKCPMCLSRGIDIEYTFEEMQGDHIIPWANGGKTTDDNLQMLCRRCNATKSAD